MITKDFLTAGRAIFTLEIPSNFSAAHNCPTRCTFRVNLKKGDATYKWDTYFVGVLTGPNNETDYSYLGILNPETGEVRLTKASKMDDASLPVRLLRRVTARLWADDGDAVEASGFKLHHEGRCCRCGRTLTVPESIESGVGPECAQILARG